MTRFAGRRWILRSITTVLITAVGLLLLSAILPGFSPDGWPAALTMALVVGVVNALVWPLVSLERVEALHPSLIPTLRHHPGIGFVMVRSEGEGAVVLGARGSTASPTGT